MLAWLSENIGTILIILVLAAIVALAIRSIVKDRKSGKSSCGGNCSACGAQCEACGQYDDYSDILEQYKAEQDKKKTGE